MEKLTCEACGSRELTKHEGYYICDYCQTKYIDKKQQSEQKVETAEQPSIKNIPLQEATAPQPQFVEKPKKNSIIKRAFGILFMVFGVFILLGSLLDLSNGHLGSFLWFGSFGFLLFNTGFTYKTRKNVLLTKRFKPWQLWLTYFFVLFILEAFFK